ncbi:hypothetical protein GCM10022291_12260 [Postechiella marina]|uniref:O-antigen polymerase n=1 Tax=Postechiella marina TaxID=943941 RepID=A0ABP8C667_9FLAO
MQLLIFLVLTIAYITIGFQFLKNRDISVFLKLTVLLPITSSLIPLHTHFQVNVYYFFSFIVVVAYFFQTLFKPKMDKNIVIVTALLIGFIGFYLLYDVLIYKENLKVINLLKDFKPLIFILFGFVFLYVLKNRRLNWKGKEAKKIMKYNFIATIVWFVILNTTGFISFATNDPYYSVTDIRYTSVGASFILIYYIAGLGVNRKFDKYDLAYILIPLFLSGNRTVLFTLAVIYLINMVMVTTNAIKLFSRIGVFVSAGLVLFFGVFSFNEKLRTRILTMFDYDIVMRQLIEFRFAPFIEKLNTYSWYDYFFGKGIGETIFIPWFVWRETVDNYNIYMDNIFLTLYIKYGVFSLIVVFLLIHFINQTKTNKRFKILLLIYFFIMGLTTAFMYQAKFLFILIVLASFSFETKTLNRKE